MEWMPGCRRSMPSMDCSRGSVGQWDEETRADLYAGAAGHSLDTELAFVDRRRIVHGESDGGRWQKGIWTSRGPPGGQDFEHGPHRPKPVGTAV